MAKVITLDLAKQLAEAAEAHGVELPESEYVWAANKYQNTKLLTFKPYVCVRRKYVSKDLPLRDIEKQMSLGIDRRKPFFNAYQTDELLEWIRKSGAREIRLWPFKNNYWGGCYPFSLPKDNQLSNTPRDTVCRLAIDLVEKGIIT